MIVKEATKMYFFFGRERHILARRIPGGHAKWVEWLNDSSKKHQKPKWFTYLLLWSKIGVVSFETLLFASKIFRCWRLMYPSFVASFLEKTWWSLWKLQVEAHKAAQKKIIEAYDPHKDAGFCGDLFAGLGMSSRVNQTIRTLVSIGCQPTKKD